VALVTESPAARVLRRSPGRLRVHAPALGAAADPDASRRRIAAIAGVRAVRLSPRTGNVLVEFDQARIDEGALLALIADGPVSARRARDPRGGRGRTPAAATEGWLRAERSETIRARPADCIGALLEFERYPEWQTYVTAVRVTDRDQRGRGARVLTGAQFGARQIELATTYRYPSPNRVVFAQEDGELGAGRGSWAFRSSGAGRTRATCVLEFKPGWRLRLILRGVLYERAREAVLDHVLAELRTRVETGAG